MIVTQIVPGCKTRLTFSVWECMINGVYIKPKGAFLMRTVSKAQGMLLLILVNVMWGLSFIFSKTALAEGIPSMTLALLRYAMTAALLLPICFIREKGIRLRAFAPRALATTLLGITVYYFFEYAGLRRTTASAASLILALVPMMTLLARALFLRERIALSRLACVLVSLLGVFLIIRADAGEGAGTLQGNLLMVMACLCWTGYILLSPRLMASCSSLRVTTWQAVAAVVTFAPFALAERSAWILPSLRALGCIFLLAAVCSALCYFLYGIAIRSVDSLTVSLAININPIAACLGGFLLLGERLTPGQLLGGVLIMACVLADAVWGGKNGA